MTLDELIIIESDRIKPYASGQFPKPIRPPLKKKRRRTQTNITLSLKKKKLILGTWQGIFLVEHRKQNRSRDIMFHFIGE